MTKTIKIRINPDILKWARDEAGYSIPEIVKQLNIEEKSYIEWETTGDDIPVTKLKDIASKYKRQIAVFFLPKVPNKTVKPSDHRNLTAASSKLSKETLLAIRRTDKLRNVLIELNGDNLYTEKYKWINNLKSELTDTIDIQKQTTLKIRNIVKYTIDDQINDKDLTHSYSNWRKAIEQELGIHIFQFTMPRDEIQGFCYSEKHPYCITVNSKYHITSRIFTIFHELSHILNNQSNMCIPDDVTEDQIEELKCNSFAGRILLPENVMKRITNNDELYRYANKLKVSSEVYLRRMNELNLITSSEFFTILNEIRKAVTPYKPYGRAGPLQKSINSRGQSLFNTIVDALNKSRISYERAADILDVKINYLINA